MKSNTDMQLSFASGSFSCHAAEAGIQEFRHAVGWVALALHSVPNYREHGNAKIKKPLDARAIVTLNFSIIHSDSPDRATITTLIKYISFKIRNSILFQFMVAFEQKNRIQLCITRCIKIRDALVRVKDASFAIIFDKLTLLKDTGPLIDRKLSWFMG